MKESEIKAYALGYYDGRTEGVENDTYDNDALRHMYRRGYDAGVADFEYVTDELRANGPRA